MANSNLHKARKIKNDEFYTQLSDIEREVWNYKDHFKNKIVFLNCDDPEESNFWKYFEMNFQSFKLKKLIATHYNPNRPGYKLEILEDGNIVKTNLKQNGDFRSEESADILAEVDIVVTNPPFSLFRDFVAQLIEYGKKFLVVGSLNAITYKDIFRLIKDDELWLGVNNLKEFRQPDGTFKKFGNINWYTNLDHRKRQEDFILHKKYSPKEHVKYDDYDIINVDRAVNIPDNYYEPIGVPISFLAKVNPNQFKVVDLIGPTMNGEKKYKRLIIQRVRG